jgi:septum formation protein
VLTSVAMRFESRWKMTVNETVVRFRTLSPADIQAYVESGEPMDKAGGYAIQGRAAAFVPELRGSYSGVMGLPLYETAQLIETFRAEIAVLTR